MANIFNRLWSKADFWDKQENARQQAQFNQQDAEEKKKRQQQAAQTRQAVVVDPSVPQPGAVIQPKSFTDTVGSQSSTPASNPLNLFAPIKAQPVKSTQPAQPQSVTRNGQTGTLVNNHFVPDAPKKQNIFQRAIKTGKDTVSSAGEAVEGLGLATARTGTGIVQGVADTPSLVAHASDWVANKATGSTGNSRYTKGIDRATKVVDHPLNAANQALDRTAADHGGTGGYKAEQVLLNIGSLVPAGVAAATKIPKVGEAVVKADQALNGIKGASKIDQILRIASLGKYGRALPPFSDAKSAGEVIHAAEDLPEEALAATGIGAFAGDSVSKAKYGESPLTGKSGNHQAPYDAGGEGAKIHGKSSGYTDETPTTEVVPGVKTKNISSEPPEINVDNQPAYQRGTPTTVGEADTQNRMTGAANVPDEVFSADARVGNFPIDTPAERALDVPTYLRNGADRAVADAQGKISSIDERLANGRPGGQVGKFNDKAEIAAAYAESPAKGKAVERLISSRNERINPEAAKVQALGDRRLATQDLAAAQDAQAARDTLQNIPDPTSPIVPARAEAAPAGAVEGGDPTQVMADFRQAIEAQPTRAVPAEAPVAEAVATPAEVAQAAAPPETTPLVSADEVNPNLADTAVEQPAPAPVETPPATTNTPGEANAPRTRAQAASLIDDQQAQNDVLDAFPHKKNLNIKETHDAAKATVNNQTPQEIVGDYPDGISIKEPDQFFKAVESVKRLQTMRNAEGEILPEAKNAITNAIDAMTEFSGKAGQSLRTVQILFDDMPSSMKVAYLTKKLSRAGAELSDADRARLDTLIQASDSATDELRVLQDEANNLLDNGVINNANLDPATKQYVDNLVSKIDTANRERELKAGEAWQEYQAHLPKGTRGKRVGDTARTLMLSSPSGRLFDILSTSATTADDLVTRGVSNLIGKGVNKVTHAGNVESTVSAPTQLLKGLKDGFQRTKDAFHGRDYVTDFMGQAKRATRGDIQTGGTKFRQVVRGAVEMPTNLTKGLETEQLYRSGVQEANQIGLTGESADLYGKLRAAVPTDIQRNTAEQVHLRANMLHDNGISKALNNVANALDQKGGGWAAPLIRNQIAPFTSWIGGNLHRTLTDKNVLFNAFKIADGALKGDSQVVVDNIARLSVNTGEAFGIGTILTKAGIITNTDANGNNYGGLYFHIGNRYVPVAVAGTVSVPLILGNAFSQASDAAADGGNGVKTFVDSLVGNTARNAGVASTFGGDNTLQSAISEATSPGGSPSAGIADYTAGVAGQFIPSLTGDINSVLDMTPLNPDHTASQTKVTAENPETGRQVTDPFATAARRTENRIPGLSQSLPRNEDGKTAADPFDRIVHGNHATGSQEDNKAVKQSLSDIKKQLTKDKVPLTADDISAAMKDGNFDAAEKGLQYQIMEEKSGGNSKSKLAGLNDKLTQATLEKQGVPVTDDGIEARTESGDYDQATAGLNYQYDKIKDDKNVPESKKQAVKDKITTIGVLKDGGFDPSVVKAYKDTSNADWREMGDDTSDMYDPDTYNMLKQYDDALAAAGVSGSTKKNTLNKFIPKSNGKGRGGKANGGINTSIATQSFSKGGGFDPIKAESASNGAPASAIPTIDRVPNFDTSKIRKITVQ